ncbi:hypothetical protein RHOFW510R12_00190 [Rhodanobacter sp. FW510-R12]|nr:hypothetical protein RHOFW104R8_04055 [Rhodanobacter sp. FW104-R8]KZC28377.1 hypothetical protein RhoFW510T8_11745 [Rhodanobacter sp. FW510-T8]KZC32753.1 hypothetical protein RhoFW510R10_11265 [Rhodanobacter sp. FW510-R10]
MLSVEQLVYRRATGQPAILDGIDLALDTGDVLCLLGPNGTGKTTLLRCLIGALQPERGCVRIDGVAQHDARKRALILAYVPQAAGDSGLSLLDIVLMGRTPHLRPLATPGTRDRQLAHEALQRVGISRLADRPFNRASGGERQLALIARALAQQPRLLLLDEPTASLDLGNQARVLRMIRDLAADGLAVLLTTHQPEHALLLRSLVVTLAGGRVGACGPATEVLQGPSLSALYQTPVEVISHHGVPLACVPLL